jgi:hypothetical protein
MSTPNRELFCVHGELTQVRLSYSAARRIYGVRGLFHETPGGACPA